MSEEIRFLVFLTHRDSEKLQLVPEQLDARISDKHFLLAVELLQDALRIIRRSDMENIGALADLRIYFSNQETVSQRIVLVRTLLNLGSR